MVDLAEILVDLRDDLALEATGPAADTWLGVAQAFAGPPGAGRQPKPAHDQRHAPGRQPTPVHGQQQDAGRQPAAGTVVRP